MELERWPNQLDGRRMKNRRPLEVLADRGDGGARDEWHGCPLDFRSITHAAVEMVAMDPYRAPQQTPFYPLPIDPAVSAEEFAIVDAEGWHHVDRIYYANLSDAAIQRRLVAERRIRDRQRFERWAANHPEELAA